MGEELIQKINYIQRQINSNWRNSSLKLDLVEEFTSAFNFIYLEVKNYLLDDANKNQLNDEQIMNCLLLINHFATSVKFLRKTVEKNNEEEISLSLKVARDSFIERTNVFLEKTKLRIIFNDNADNEESFFNLIESLLDKLQFFKELQNNACKLPIEETINEIKKQTQKLISAITSFKDISLKNEMLEIYCGKLRKSSRKLSSNLEKCEIKNTILELENILYGVEKTLNNSLLKLIFQVFHELNQKPINYLKKISENSAMENELENFKNLLHRVLFLGNFSAELLSEENLTSAITLRSCLTFLEMMKNDHFLISSCELKSLEILQDNFEEECEKLMTCIHQIVDTNALCNLLIEDISETISLNQKDFKKSSFDRLVDFSKIFLVHILINFKELKVNDSLQFQLDDFKLILEECDAILKYPDINNFEKRCIKRFNILVNSIRKLIVQIKLSALKNQDEDQKVSFSIRRKSIKIKEETFNLQITEILEQLTQTIIV